MSAHTLSRIPIAAPDIGLDEEEAVLRVLRSGRLAQGAEVARLEEEFAAACGVEHAVAVVNGTAALHAALWAAGVGAGDEVLVPAFTFAATANAVVATGAAPVFVDIGEDFLIDLEHAEALVTEKTKAVMAVHLYGLMADVGRVEELADRQGLAIVEDAAQAHLAQRGGRTAGATGIGAFSLYATKNMTSGEGGLVTTADRRAAEAIRRFRNHGMATRYRHDEWGLNYRLTDIAAAIARAQLRKLEAANARRRENADYYTANLSGFFTPQPVPPGAVHVYHQYVVRVEAGLRDAAVGRLREEGVDADIHYPIAVNRQPAFERLDQADSCRRAHLASQEVLALPVHPLVDDSARERVVSTANTAASELR